MIDIRISSEMIVNIKIHLKSVEELDEAIKAVKNAEKEYDLRCTLINVEIKD